MSFENLENIISLLCNIAGLLYCVFKYIETPRRGYRYIIVFFLANILSEFYWTIYGLVMRSYPDVSEFAAYLGWNVAFLFLLFAAYTLRSEEAKRNYHPVVLIPFLINIPLLFLYIKFGGILNNLWMVGTTTLTAVFCMQQVIYYLQNRRSGLIFPWFAVLVLAFVTAEYGMWTASCFDWPGPFQNPYIYCSIFASVVTLFFPYGAKRHYDSEIQGREAVSASEMRLQVTMQTFISIVIMVICAAGFFVALRIRESIEGNNEDRMVIWLFAISAILIAAVLGLLYLITTRYRRLYEGNIRLSEGRRNRLNFIFTIIVTLALMTFVAAYNSIVLYRSSVAGVYEDARGEIRTTATDLENYLTVAATTLRVAADTVDLMEQNGSSIEDIEKYIVDETTRQAEQFDENFTGIYAYINGKYLDGLGWVPPEGYEPTERDWYKAAAEANGEIVIVSPYVDAQTGSVVITIGKSISGRGDSGSIENEASYNVVCLDVIVNHIQEITDDVEIAGKGYGMVVNSDGFIISHHDHGNNGKNFTDVYSRELLDRMLDTGEGRINANIGGEDCTLVISPVMDQWYSVIVIGNTELFEETYSQLAINVMVSIITFLLITFFYYVGYRNEQIYGRRVEEMNIQVVSALASAIDAKDNYTNGHSSRVAEYSRMIAARAGYSKNEQDEIYMMGLLHDVGKIGVPDSVINKPAKLTEEEFELIKKHPVIGGGILGSIKERPKLATGARWHHERYDGDGYPDGIAGEEIPEEARIIAVADAYDAMTSRRSYRDIMSQDKVRSEIENGMGTQFDPRFAAIMLRMIDEDKDYTMREQ